MTAAGLTPGPHVLPLLLEDIEEPPVPELVYIAATLLRALETLEGRDLRRRGARPENVARERDLSADTGTAPFVVAPSLLGASISPCAGARPTQRSTRHPGANTCRDASLIVSRYFSTIGPSTTKGVVLLVETLQKRGHCCNNRRGSFLTLLILFGSLCFLSEFLPATNTTGGGNRLNPTMRQSLALKASRSVRSTVICSFQKSDSTL